MSRPFSDMLETVGGVDIKELYAIDEPLTKQELEEIKRCLKYMIKGGVTPYSSVTLETKKKIQSMIDRHCDHQPIWETPNHVICYCQVCKKVLEK